MKFNFNKKISVIFLGNPKISVYALKSLIKTNKFKIEAVITNNDKPAGRKHSIAKETELSRFISDLNLKLIKTNDINKDIHLIQNLQPDLIITCAFGQKLSNEILNLPKINSLNIHASLLPKGRGGSPINWAIINGEKETGFTIMKMEEQLDSGEYYFQKKILISQQDTFDTLYNKICELIYEYIGKTIYHLVKKPSLYKPIVQDISQVSYWNIIKKEEAYVDFNKSANEVFNYIRGLNSVPGARVQINGKNMKIYSVKIYQNNGNKYNDKRYYPGEIINIDKNGILIATKTDFVIIDDILIENKKRIKVKDFINGNKLFVIGDIFNK